MNRHIKILGVVILLCYFAAFVKLNQLQVVDADRLTNHPGNSRQQLRDFNRPRGDILTSDGEIIATSEERRAQLQYQRVYPHGDLYGHISGYLSFNLGSTGVESVYHDDLSGQNTTLQLREIFNIDALTSQVSTEADVVLSIQDPLQRAAREALAGQRGSVVVLNPQTGAILAMYSNPPFDPNLVSTNDGESAERNKALLELAEERPMLARTYQERFFPGSTFKIITAAAGLNGGVLTPTEPVFPNVQSFTPQLTERPISNFANSYCGGNLMEVITRSCNAAFAQMSVELIGPDGMIATAEAFGFNEAVPLDLTGMARSQYPEDFGELVSRPEDRLPIYGDEPRLAQTSIGQNDVAATPLQMALTAAGVANNGQIMTPHVMSEIRAHDGSVVRRFEPSVWKTPMQPAVAATLREAMMSVVNSGTAQMLQVPGVTVGAKTGTAQLGTDPPKSHAWMMAFAGPPNEAPTIAVAVVVEGVDEASGSNPAYTGGRVAGPIARQMIEAAL